MPSTPSRDKRSRSSSGSPSPSQRPPKRLRSSWSTVVEGLALANGTEEDEHRVSQRQKQIDYGKNTIAYDRFAAVKPREKRVRGDPMTPIAKQKCSKRSFAGQVTSWKKKVYDFVANLALAEEEDKKRTENDFSIPEDKTDMLASRDKSENTASGSAEAEATVEDVVMKETSNDAGKDGTNERTSLLQKATDVRSGTLTCKNSTRSDHSKTIMASDEEEEDISDLDDIELDDQGNVIFTSATPPPTSDNEPYKKALLENSPPSIFDVY